MAPIKSESMPLLNEQHIVLARQAIRRITQEMGFKLVDQTKIVTATSELARNAVVHGGGGVLNWQELDEGARQGLKLTFSDEGSGIADIGLAMKEGYTTGKGLGMGLPGTKRLVNEFEIESHPGKGTRVTIIKWK
jgi:serine/threonine-protein kinase RsbT